MSKYAIFGMCIQCISFTMIFASANAQKKSVEEIEVSIGFYQSEVEEVFYQISDLTKFDFSYKSNVIKQKQNQKLTFAYNRVSVADILRYISKETNLKFKRVDGTIYVTNRHRNQSAVSEDEIYIIQQLISGRVTDNLDEGLPGVSVAGKNTTIGTVTDADGNYTLELPDNIQTVVFSYVGFKTQEIDVATRSVINVVLEPDVTQLKELVVVGYGTVERSDLTGSVASVSSEQINRSPVNSVDQALIGVAPGVRVVQSSGAPGSGTTIRIRGGNSITAGNEPLFVVDGIPGVGDLTTINPNDIESIEVLKDASATAIYGARGANGVVLITTKSGEKGQNRVNYDGYVGVQSVFETIDLISGTEFAELRNEVDIQQGVTPTFSNPSEFGQGTNWQDEIFRDALIQNHNLTFSGGGKTATYYIGMNYFNQEGIIENSELDRYSLRFNLKNKFTNWLEVGTNTVVSRVDNNLATVESLDALRFWPTVPVRDADGNFALGDINARLIDNPVALAIEPIDELITSKVLSSIYGEASIIEGLKLKVHLGVDGSFRKRNEYRPRSLQEQVAVNGTATVSSEEEINLLNENTLTYSKNINENSSIDAVAGISFQSFNLESVTATSTGFTTDAFTFNNLSAGTNAGTPLSASDEWGIISYLGRVNFTHKDKYLFTLAGRYDGSSRFGSGNKYAFFPSGAFAWRLSEEDFIQSIGALDDLKLRMSYGVTGNQEIETYRSLATLSNAFHNFGESLVAGFATNRLANPDLKWEKTSQFDIGLDFSVLNNRLNVTFDYYRKKTSDLLLNVVVPSVSGFTTALQNIGGVENSGVELNINSVNVNSGKLKWETSFNLSHNKNEVTDLGGDEQVFVASSTAGLGALPAGILRIGEPVGSFFGLISEGTWKSQEEIDASGIMLSATPGSERFRDVDGSGLVDGDDRVILGSSVPEFFGGLTNWVTFQNFEFLLVTDFSYGNEIFNFTDAFLAAPTGGFNLYDEFVDRWSPTNSESDIIGGSITAAGLDPKSRWIKDGSYFRFREISIAYNLPTENISWLKSARVALSGTNLIRFDNYNGYDPLVSGSGQDNLRRATDLGGYPTSKIYRLTFSIGL